MIEKTAACKLYIISVGAFLCAFAADPMLFAQIRRYSQINHSNAGFTAIYS
jgi:hypothetical protein